MESKEKNTVLHTKRVYEYRLRTRPISRSWWFWSVEHKSPDLTGLPLHCLILTELLLLARQSVMQWSRTEETHKGLWQILPTILWKTRESIIHWLGAESPKVPKRVAPVLHPGSSCKDTWESILIFSQMRATTSLSPHPCGGWRKLHHWSPSYWCQRSISWDAKMSWQTPLMQA